MKLITICTIVALVTAGGLLVEVYAQEEVSRTGELTVPWDEFRKLLNLDEDEIILSLETFQKLLAQTGIETTPPHGVREGNVVLERAEFKKLVDQMKPPTGLEGKPPFDYLITKAFYSGDMREENTIFTGTFNVHVLRKGAYLKVPLLPQSIALADIKVGSKEALVVSENGYHNVVLSKEGEYEVTATFSLTSSLKQGPHKIDLAIQQTPITLLRLRIPLKDIDIEIPQARQVLTSLSGDGTTVSAVIAQGASISVRWRKKVALAEKVPPKLYCEVNHLISIEDDVFKVSSDINYNILHSEVAAVVLAIPENMNVLAVSGEGVGEWQESAEHGERLLTVPFTYGKKGAVVVRITTEGILSETGLGTSFSGIRATDTVRETGFIGIELNTSAEVVVTESHGLEKVATQKLPRQLIDKSAKPLITGFKYLKHPYTLVLDVKKHERIAVPVATVNSASAVTLFTEDGKVVHRLVYQLRNTAKQFLEIEIPDDGDVWSVFVDGQPVESSINTQGKLLVPLIRSRSVDNQLDTFPVEIVYCMLADRYSMLGSQESSLPAVDLLISQLIWSVYLPNDYGYFYFSSTLEKEEIIRGVNVFARAQRRYDESAMKEIDAFGDVRSRDEMDRVYKGEDYKSSFRNVPLEEKQMLSQVEAEIGFSGRLEGLTSAESQYAGIPGTSTSTGVLPIHVQVPTSGQVYRFAKTIIKPEDSLGFSVVYARLWVIGLFRWLIVAIIILILLLNRRNLVRLVAGIRERSTATTGLFTRHDRLIKRCIQSLMTPFVLLGLILVFWPISRFLTSLFFFALWVTGIYQVLRLLRKRAKAKSRARSEPEERGPAGP